MALDQFGRDSFGMIESWRFDNMARIAVKLASFPAEKLLDAYSKKYNFLMREDDILPILTISMALLIKGVPPSLRSAFPTDSQMRYGTTTRTILILGDLLWLCSKEVVFHKLARSVINCLRGRDYSKAASCCVGLYFSIESTQRSQRASQKEKILSLIRRHEQQLVILPCLFSRREKRVEPKMVRLRLEEGRLSARCLPSRGQTRKMNMEIIYSSLYVAGCFHQEGGYAEAARYYNALVGSSDNLASSSYMRKLHSRLLMYLDKALVKPIKPVKQKEYQDVSRDYVGTGRKPFCGSKDP